MGLEYRLFQTDVKERVQKLKLELAPRISCRSYVLGHGCKAELIRKDEFDTHYRKKIFVDGPHKETFGDGPGEPYNPHWQAFERLKSRVVYCELSKEYQEKTEELFKLLKI
jgi:hypothetical protein